MTLALIVPNAPCGVESRVKAQTVIIEAKFLMHRVELKAQGGLMFLKPFTIVPNAPCGVESSLWRNRQSLGMVRVPNAPCGVESPPQRGPHPLQE